MGIPLFFQFRWNELTQEQLTTSHFFNPKFLLAYRSFWSLWVTAVLFASIGIFPVAWGVYLTHLSYLAIWIYYLLIIGGSIASLLGKKLPNLYVRFTSVWFATLLTCHVVVPVVFWLFLSAGFSTATLPGKFTNVSMHGLDIVVLIFEFLVCRIQLFPIHMVFMIMICWLYLFFAMAIHAADGFWVYPFLDWTKKIIAAYYVGFTVAVCILHLIWVGLTLLRNKATKYDPAEKMADVDMKGPQSTSGNA